MSVRVRRAVRNRNPIDAYDFGWYRVLADHDGPRSLLESAQSIRISLPTTFLGRTGYTDRVEPPLKRELLDERNALDDRDAAVAVRELSPVERLKQALDLSDAARALARSVGARWIEAPHDDVAEKARRTPALVSG